MHRAGQSLSLEGLRCICVCICILNGCHLLELAQQTGGLVLTHRAGQSLSLEGLRCANLCSPRATPVIHFHRGHRTSDTNTSRGVMQSMTHGSIHAISLPCPSQQQKKRLQFLEVQFLELQFMKTTIWKYGFWRNRKMFLKLIIQ